MRLLQVEGLTASRKGHVLLERLRFEVRTGQVTAIIADNPDRLHFLVNILGGLEAEQTGVVHFNGHDASPALRRRRVGIAREQTSLVETLPVLDNLFLSNNRRHTWFGMIRRSARAKQARAILRRLECQVSLDIPVHAVEPGARVLLDVARVLIQEPDLYVFNGTTRTMSLRQYEAFLGVVAELRATGKGVVVIPLNAQEVRTCVDKLYFLRGNELLDLADGKNLTDEELNGFFLGTATQRVHNVADPIQKARLIIDEQAELPDIDFQELSDRVAMSYDNFRRRFKSQLGMSPKQYFLAVKVEKARDLLQFTDADIKTVAQQLGFSDPYYFSRVFKERVGVSPAKFRST